MGPAAELDTPLIQTKAQTKRFPMVLAIDAIDFEVRKGEIHCLLGENGAGKTTLAECAVHQMGVGATGGSREDYTSGLEPRFYAEVAHAAIGLTRDEANELALRLVDRYEATIDDPLPRRPFAEVYDPENLEPTTAWMDCDNQVREEIIGMGLDLDAGWRHVRHGD